MDRHSELASLGAHRSADRTAGILPACEHLARPSCSAVLPMSRYRIERSEPNRTIPNSTACEARRSVSCSAALAASIQVEHLITGQPTKTANEIAGADLDFDYGAPGHSKSSPPAAARPGLTLELSAPIAPRQKAVEGRFDDLAVYEHSVATVVRHLREVQLD